ncbi:hypothetical protein V8F33_005138 [Rhypophila sp. PSN 637]
MRSTIFFLFVLGSESIRSPLSTSGRYILCLQTRFPLQCSIHGRPTSVRRFRRDPKGRGKSTPPGNVANASVPTDLSAMYEAGGRIQIGN